FLDFDDRRGPVVRIDDGLANLKKHAVVSFRQTPEYHSDYALRFAARPSRTPAARLWSASGGGGPPPRMLRKPSSSLEGSVMSTHRTLGVSRSTKRSRLIASIAVGAAVALGTTG